MFITCIAVPTIGIILDAVAVATAATITFSNPVFNSIGPAMLATRSNGLVESPVCKVSSPVRARPSAITPNSTRLSSIKSVTHLEFVMAAPAVSIKTGKASSMATVNVIPGRQTASSNSPVPKPPISNLIVWASLCTGKRTVIDSFKTGIPKAVFTGPITLRNFLVELGSNLPIKK